MLDFSKINFVSIKKFVKNNKSFSIYSIVAATAAIFSTISCAINFQLSKNIEHNYLYKIQLTHDDNKNNKTQTLKTAQERLTNFYKNNTSSKIFVNVDAQGNTDEKTNLFLHQKSTNINSDINKSWLDLVKLNQLSIDRYGHEFEDSGNKKNNSTLKVIPIVKWADVNENSLKKIKEKDGNEAISFNFFNTSIKDLETKILANTDTNKYKYEESEKNVNNNWFFWLDKELLTVKLNYIFVTWLFNQNSNLNKSFVTDVVGASSSRTTDQKQKYQIIKNNYKQLSSIEREFAQNYDSLVRTEDNKESFSHTNLIKVDHLNKIVNIFNAQQKDLSVFNGHLLYELKAGDTDSYNKTFAHKNTSPQELIATTSSKEGSTIKFSVNSEKNKDFTNDKLLDLLKNYSIKGLKFSENTSANTKDTVQIWPSAVYSTNQKNNLSENIHVFYMPKKLDNYNQNLLILSIFLFILCCGIIVSCFYKIPGIIAFFSFFLSSFLSIGILSLSGIEFSAITFVAMFAISLLAIFQIFNFLKQFQRELKIGKSPLSAWVASGKKSAFFCLDSFLILLLFSSLITFAAPLELRKFGMILSIMTFVFWTTMPVNIGIITTFFLKNNFEKTSLYYGNLIKEMPRKLFVNNEKIEKFNKKFNSYIALLLVPTLIAISFWFLSAISINTNLLFKDSYLLTLNTNSYALKNSSDNFSENSIFESQNSNKFVKIAINDTKNIFYLISDSLNFSELTTKLNSKFNEGAFSLQKTKTFAETEVFIDLLHISKWIFLMCAVYLWVRFGFIYFINLIISSGLIFIIFFATILLSQTKINYLFHYAFMALSLLIISQNVWFANTSHKHKQNTHLYSDFDMSAHNFLILQQYKNNFCFDLMWLSGLFVSTALSFFSGFASLPLLLFLVAIIICFALLPIEIMVWKLSQMLKNKYYQLLSGVKNTNNIMEKLLTWDPYDEEMITGINKIGN